MKKSTMSLLTNVTNLIKDNIDTVTSKKMNPIYSQIILNNTLPITINIKELTEFNKAPDKVLWILLVLIKNTDITAKELTWWYHNKYNK